MTARCVFKAAKEEHYGRLARWMAESRFATLSHAMLRLHSHARGAARGWFSRRVFSGRLMQLARVV